MLVKVIYFEVSAMQTTCVDTFSCTCRPDLNISIVSILSLNCDATAEDIYPKTKSQDLNNREIATSLSGKLPGARNQRASFSYSAEDTPQPRSVRLALVLQRSFCLFAGPAPACAIKMVPGPGSQARSPGEVRRLSRVGLVPHLACYSQW